MTKTATVNSKRAQSTTKSRKVVKSRVIRAVKDKEPKLVENTKKVLVLRGKTCNMEMTQILRDLRTLVAPNAKLLSKKNGFYVFEDESQLEFLMQKNDTSLFLFASHTKKRSHNLVLGRTFDGHILDMMELELCNIKFISSFNCKSKKAPGSKPCFVFTGSEWDTDENYAKLKNILLDIFRGTVVNSVNVKGLDHAIVCTSYQDKVAFRSYSIAFTKSLDTHPSVQLQEMGPRFDINFRRQKFASQELFKAATRKPKALVTKKVKNVSHDDLTGNKLGQIHLDRQDVYAMQTRRVKALRKTHTKKTDSESEVANEDTG